MSEKVMKFTEVKNFTEDLIDWQKKLGRHDLPWQKNRTAYRVWLSEIMLQQTQVSTVLNRYDEFLKIFPTVESLGAATVDQVLAQWSGMGYYTRARNLHRCAQTVMAEHNGVFPSDPKALESLPGIGRSTAAAIAVFAYGKRAAILDGNVKRVLARIWGFDQDLSKTLHTNQLWAHAESLLPHKKSDLIAYTQGLMDFGATHCTQYQPACIDPQNGSCPFKKSCVAYLSERVNQIPLKIKKVKVEKIDMTWWVMIHQNKVLLEKRPEKGIWAGLWCFPVSQDQPKEPCQTMAAFKHVLTHRQMTIKPIKVHLKKSVTLKEHQQWFALDDVVGLGLPKPMSLFLKSLDLARDGE
jgi:A/G-specific adenine glycosylase